MLTLKAENRDINTKLSAIRNAGKIPAVFYGKKEASTPISLSSIDFMKVWKQAGESSVVTLNTEDGEKDSLIHDVDIDPISGAVRHADFYVFEKGHKVQVDLPIEFEGVSPAIKDKGGVLVKVLHELKIEAMPKDLPHNIIIDLTSLLEIGDQVLAKDIVLTPGVELIDSPEEVIALISAPREEKEEEETPMDLSQIEVEKKGKDDEETEEASGDSKDSAE
jgi:large subunit ribosomal protein L25